VCVWYEELGASSSQLVVPGTHTAGSKLRCQTPTTHTKNITSNFSQTRSTLLTIDRKRSETCRSDF